MMDRWIRIEQTLGSPCSIHLPLWSQILFLFFLCIFLCYKGADPHEWHLPRTFTICLLARSAARRHWWEIGGRRGEKPGYFSPPLPASASVADSSWVLHNSNCHLITSPSCGPHLCQAALPWFQLIFVTPPLSFVPLALGMMVAFSCW